MPSTAIYIPVCSTRVCSCTKNHPIPHHLTLVHLNTTDQKIINLALKKINQCILNNKYLQMSNQRKIATYHLGVQGPRSTYLEGNIKNFKVSLDRYLRLNPTLANHMSPFRDAHVDRCNISNIPFYSVLRVEDLKIFKRN